MEEQHGKKKQLCSVLWHYELNSMQMCGNHFILFFPLYCKRGVYFCGVYLEKGVIANV